MTSLSGNGRESILVHIERAVALIITGLLLWVGASVSELKTDVARIQVHVDYLRAAVADIKAGTHTAARP